MPAATVPDHRTTFQRGDLSGPFHPALAAFRRRFAEEMSLVIMKSRTDVLDQLRPVLENVTDSNDQVEISEKLREAHIVFHTSLFNCFDSMGSLVREWFSKLIKLAEHHPEWTIDDSPQWVRSRMQELLDIQLSEQQELKGPYLERPHFESPYLESPRLHVVDRWFRCVCRDLYDSETDLPQSWCAPIWFAHLFSVSLWIRKGCPYHLTAEVTQYVVKHWRESLDGRLKNALDRAEDYARIEVRSSQDLSKAEEKNPNRPTGERRPRDKQLQARQRKIIEVAKRGVTGLRYCQVLATEGLETPQRWQSEGCPKSYPAAYQHPDSKWRARITDEKYKATHQGALAKTRN